jgi:hypothetical protein
MNMSQEIPPAVPPPVPPAFASSQPVTTPEAYAKQEAQKKASSALTMSIIAFFCFGPILGPIAIVRASNAKKVLTPTDPGYGNATAAQICGAIAIAIWVLLLIYRFSQY